MNTHKKTSYQSYLYYRTRSGLHYLDRIKTAVIFWVTIFNNGRKYADTYSLAAFIKSVINPCGISAVLIEERSK